jgi:hypothetical protein
MVPVVVFGKMSVYTHTTGFWITLNTKEQSWVF